MNGSSLSKLEALGWVTAGLAVVHGGVELAAGRIGPGLIFPVAIAAAGIASALFVRRLRESLKRASGVCKAVAAGDLEARITHIHEGGELGDLLWSVNELADRTDAFLREGAASMEKVARAQYFRRIMPSGFQGAFRHSGEAINSAVRAMGEQVAEQRRVEGEVAEIVAAAADGDFTRRLSTDDKQGFMLTLGEGINQVLDTVQSGLDELVQVIEAMARGDLSLRMQKDYKGAFAQLKADSNEMAERLDAIVGAIVQASRSVHVGVSEIASGNSDLARRTEEQASKLEAMAAAVEELTATVRKNAENTKEADDLAAGARRQADEGGKVVHDVIDAMGRIQSSSSRIADIVGMIDEIAFQTNLLALNAAVEAARAGEAGKGFAVVANEVRSLAQRSAESSREIRRLIGASQSEVGHGVELIHSADRTLKEIIGSVQKLADIVSEIATATGEQSMALDDVARSVNVIEDMTQKNAALAEETASASLSVNGQAEDLQDAVTYFKVAQAEPAAPKKKLRVAR